MAPFKSKPGVLRQRQGDVPVQAYALALDQGRLQLSRGCAAATMPCVGAQHWLGRVDVCIDLACTAMAHLHEPVPAMIMNRDPAGQRALRSSQDSPGPRLKLPCGASSYMQEGQDLHTFVTPRKTGAQFCL